MEIPKPYFDGRYHHPMKDAAREFFKGDQYPFLNEISVLQAIAKAQPGKADEMVDELSKWPDTAIQRDEMKRAGELYVKIEDMLTHAAEKAELLGEGYKDRIRELETRRPEAIAFLESEVTKLQKIISVLKAGEIK